MENHAFRVTPNPEDCLPVVTLLTCSEARGCAPTDSSLWCKLRKAREDAQPTRRPAFGLGPRVGARTGYQRRSILRLDHPVIYPLAIAIATENNHLCRTTIIYKVETHSPRVFFAGMAGPGIPASIVTRPANEKLLIDTRRPTARLEFCSDLEMLACTALTSDRLEEKNRAFAPC